MRRVSTLVLLLPVLCGSAIADPGFGVRVRGVTTSLPTLGIYALPGERLPIGVVDASPSPSFDLRAPGGAVDRTSSTSWTWTAPRAAGLYPIEIGRGEESVTLNAFVLRPFDALENGRLDRYRVGSYPERPLRGLDAYRAPRGFVRVTPELARTRLSPSFTLGQFLCKQEGDYPKYVVLDERLLLTLEFLLDRARSRGWVRESFVVMSGYRTPFYNAAIGNVKYSRHQWGDAADVYIDENPVDGVMDDLNGDGRLDRADAIALYDLFDAALRESGAPGFAGGLAHYGSTTAHGPFVHVDLRGYEARW